MTSSTARRARAWKTSLRREITNAPPTGVGFDATVSVDCTVANDQLKVRAIVNQINGLNLTARPVTALRRVRNELPGRERRPKVGPRQRQWHLPAEHPHGMPGGYVDGAGTPTEVLAFGLQKTDEALGDMIQALKRGAASMIPRFHRQRQARPVTDQPG